MKKNVKSGAIYTPNDMAGAMVRWAIKEPTDKVLDLGVGEGTFVFAAYEALRYLGATEEQARSQVYGSEIDTNRFESFNRQAADHNIIFPHIENIDFFDYQIPHIGNFDVIIGNPPYIRRYSIQSVDKIRKTVLNSTGLRTDDIKNLSDLYVYFILHAATMLRPGGRLCVVTADPWLNVGYGRALKKYLLQNFSIETLLTVDRRLFSKADVRAVILHAIKLGPDIQPSQVTKFTRVLNGLPFERIPIYAGGSTSGTNDVTELVVKRESLVIQEPWGIYFKTGDLYTYLASLPQMAPTSQVAKTQIGHQTLAKDFFVFPLQKANQIEVRFLRPLAQAPKFYFKHPIIYPDDPVESYVFCCNLSKEQLQGTKALAYIEAGENKDVAVRGKGFNVTGYQSKDRIKHARRPYWYDIQTSLDKRTTSSILVPRFIYHEYLVIWNQASHVTGELFLEFIPKILFDTRVYLSILNSSLAELMFRVHAQIYGGGTSNMSPGEFKRVPMLNPVFFSNNERDLLIRAYDSFVNDPSNREPIDQVVFQLLGFDTELVKSIRSTLADLQKLSKTVKKSLVAPHIQE